MNFHSLQYAALLLIFITYPAQAEIHKWTDENGNVHYSQTAPENTKTKIISARPPPPKAAQEAATEALNERKEANEKSKLEQAIAEQNANNLKQKEDVYKANCKASTKNLETYESYQRVRVKGEDGEYTHLTDEQRQERISTMKEEASKYCATPVTLTEAETAKLVLSDDRPPAAAEEK